MPVLTLQGCPPEPLGNYLKALGVFRLVAEQADPTARAWWQGGVLRILTGFDNAALRNFFLGSDATSAALPRTRHRSGLWCVVRHRRERRQCRYHEQLLVFRGGGHRFSNPKSGFAGMALCRAVFFCPDFRSQRKRWPALSRCSRRREHWTG